MYDRLVPWYRTAGVASIISSCLGAYCIIKKSTKEMKNYKWCLFNILNSHSSRSTQSIDLCEYFGFGCRILDTTALLFSACGRCGTSKCYFNGKLLYGFHSNWLPLSFDGALRELLADQTRQKFDCDCDSGSLRGYDWSYYVFAYHVLNWHETLDHDFNLFLLDNWINPNFFWCQLYWAISGVTYMFVNIMVIWWAFERLKRSRNLLNDSARKRHFFAIVALIIQAIVPLVGYVIPLYIFSILAQTRLERNLQEPTSVFVVMLSTHGALNALVMMMVTKPYRRFLVANLKRVALCKADGRIYGASSGQLWSE
ncbi:unnamed protein product, partial [Mesorhabditis belari]|uniref:G protein-coupled receptor n=1 Tax=Mesorhabditis belari TaxID=2138241 RepID=A0AAF3ELC8_9BILA